MEKEAAPAPKTIAKEEAFKPLAGSTPKPWLERKFGECAYPVSGEGADTFSCCAPCGERTYCKAHRKVMYVPAKEPVKALVKGVVRWAA